MFSRHNATGLIVVGITISLGTNSTAFAQPIPSLPGQEVQVSSTVIAALAYPNSSQRFFEAGRAQFEQNIQQLNQNESPTTLLTIQPEVLEQFEDPPE